MTEIIIAHLEFPDRSVPVRMTLKQAKITAKAIGELRYPDSYFDCILRDKNGDRVEKYRDQRLLEI